MPRNGHPVLIFDGECGFCGRWVDSWRTLTGRSVEYLTAEQSRNRYPEIPPQRLAEAVQLVTREGRVLSGAAAAYKALEAGGHPWLWWLYRFAPGFAFASERVYHLVARHRELAGRLDRRWLGKKAGPHVRWRLLRALAASYLAIPIAAAVMSRKWTHRRTSTRRHPQLRRLLEKSSPPTTATRWVFLRLLAITYFVAFRSAHLQVRGLVGERGILPARDYLQTLRLVVPRPYLQAPTLLWLDASDRGLVRICRLGMAASALLFVGIAPIPLLASLWLLYLSLTVGGQSFLSYQWDALLLETGLVATLYAPAGLLPTRRRQAPPAAAAVWLLRWLHFRVMFSSGIAKRVSRDPTWRQATALQYHYETQPLPTWTSYYVHHLSPRFHRASVYVTWVAELLAPPLGLGPRRLRAVAALSSMMFQGLIAATGNYGFFNLLTAALAVPLLDDQQLPKLITRMAPRPAPRRRGVFDRLLAPAAIGISILGAMPLAETGGLALRWPKALMRFHARLAPLRSINPYGLFSVMTTVRPELVVEGSQDGVHWLAYELKWKPGDVASRPRFVWLHMPRLDWQMWFAALHPTGQAHWLLSLLQRLLEGSPEVLDLLGHNPFPSSPPKYVRVCRYTYRFTSARERSESGRWWRRELLDYLVPAVALPETSGAEAGRGSDARPRV